MLTSTRLNPVEYDFFKTNFDVIDANVSSLDEADTVLLGEEHNNQTDRIKNCWLLNKIVDDLDVMYWEGFDVSQEAAKEYFESQLFPISKNIIFKSWDCQESSMNLLKVKMRQQLTIDFIKECQKIFKNNLSTKETQIKKIEEMYDVWSEKEIRESINELLSQGYNIGSYSKTPDLINYNRVIYSLIRKTDRNLCDVFCLVAQYTLQILKMHFDIELKGTTMIKRQVYCGENIRNEKGKFHAFLGKGHLKADLSDECPVNEKNDLTILTKQIELLMQAVRERKYVILFPNKNRDNIQIAEDFFSSPTSKIIKIATVLFISIAILGILSSESEPLLKLMMTFTTFAIGIVTYMLFIDEKSFDKFPGLFEQFRGENIPKELVSDLVNISKELTSEIESEYLEIGKKFKGLKESEPEKTKEEEKLDLKHRLSLALQALALESCSSEHEIASTLKPE